MAEGQEILVAATRGRIDRLYLGEDPGTDELVDMRLLTTNFTVARFSI